MPIARVTDVSAEDSGFTQTNTRTTGAFNLTAGNGVAVGVRWETDNGTTISSVADTAGNTYTRVASTLSSIGQFNIEWWICQSAAAGHATNDVTVTFSSSNPYFKAAAAIQYSGQATSGTVDAVAVGNNTLANEVISAAFSTNQANEAILALVSRSSTFGEAWTWTPSSYVTIEESLGAGLGGYIVIAERIVSATQSSVTVRGDTTTANNKVISVIALKESAVVVVPARITFRNANA